MNGIWHEITHKGWYAINPTNQPTNHLDCQYQIKVDISDKITLRNCYFLRRVEFQTMFSPIPYALPVSTDSASNVPVMHSDSPISASNDTHATVGHSQQEALTYHHVLGTHTVCHHKFFELCLDYSCITLWALKNCLPLIGPCLHVGEGRYRNKSQNI